MDKWKFWQRNTEYDIPPKPKAESDQVSMIWDFLWNHLPDRLNRQDYKILWQDRKINFILILVAILVACFGKIALG